MKRLTRDEILQVQDRPTQDVEIPEWGGLVTVRALSGSERDRFEREFIEKPNSQPLNIRARLVAMSLVDEKGHRAFRDQDILALGDKSAVALERISRIAQKLSGLTHEELDDAKKNS